MSEVLVFIVGLGAVASALYTTLSRHPIYGAISLVAHIVFVALVYLSLGSPVLAVLQVLIYAGAVIVLFVYACMYVGPETGGEPLGRESRSKIIGAAVAALLVFFTAATALFLTHGKETGTVGEVDYVAMTKTLFSPEYIVPFEAVSVLLLVAIIGAIYLSRSTSKGRLERKS